MNWKGRIIDVLNHTRCFSSVCRSRPAEEPTAGSTEEPTDVTPTSWVTGSPEAELELQEPENMPGLGEEELPHMLLPDSLSQLEEFGRHKRLRKAQRGHGRPRLFSDLWVRIGDRWASVLIGGKSSDPFLHSKLLSSIFSVSLQKHFAATKREDYQWLRNSGAASDTCGAAQADGDPAHPEAPDPGLIHSAWGQLGPRDSGSQHTPAGDGFSLDLIRLVLLTTWP